MTVSLYDEAVKAASVEKPEDVAKAFLAATCPSFLEVLDASPSSTDRLIKAGRCVQATVKMAAKGDALAEKTTGALELLVEECSTMANILSGKETRKVPTVRYGKTELQIPLVTLGCMRFQQSWNRGGGDPITKIEQVEAECQENLVNILKYAISMGINHIETAKGYGCSEMQIGHALERLFKEKFCKREDLIIQTKGPAELNMTPKSYKNQIITQLQRLKLKYVDLFSVHGVNSEENFKALFDNPNGNLITAVQELQKEGKIRHIGFSTHARADLIKRTIETDAFSYLNLHHHCVGSYTASGDSDGRRHGNWANVELAHSKDMGVFIISPYDKGGRLYAPSVKLRELTLPEFEPMAYGSIWAWQYHLHQGVTKRMVHTVVCGAARPSDLDQPILASFQMIQESPEASKQLLAKTIRVSERMQQAMLESVPGGKEFVDTWHVGLPNWWDSKYGTQHGNIVWMYVVIHAFGLLDFAKDRYSTCDGRTGKWDEAKSKEENVGQLGGWAWVPGCGYNAKLDYSTDLEKCPPENQKQLKEAIEFVHKWCRPVKKGEEGAQLEIPLDWETAYDMRPWTAFPERD